MSTESLSGAHSFEYERPHMVSGDLLEILRCPLTGQAVRVPTPTELARLREATESGNATTLGGEAVTMPLEEALVRADGLVWFRVESGIPVMIPDEAISLTAAEER